MEEFFLKKPCIERPNDIDVIIFCSGYDYHLDFEVIPGERRVSPLYFFYLSFGCHQNIFEELII
jgi:hypothetical protein